MLLASEIHTCREFSNSSRAKIFLSSISCSPLSLLSIDYQCLFPQKLYQLGHEADHSSLPNAKVDNALSFTFIPLHFFMACLIKYQNNFTFTKTHKYFTKNESLMKLEVSINPSIASALLYMLIFCQNM
jgi:hypothetical protein